MMTVGRLSKGLGVPPPSSIPGSQRNPATRHYSLGDQPRRHNDASEGWFHSSWRSGLDQLEDGEPRRYTLPVAPGKEAHHINSRPITCSSAPQIKLRVTRTQEGKLRVAKLRVRGVKHGRQGTDSDRRYG